MCAEPPNATEGVTYSCGLIAIVEGVWCADGFGAQRHAFAIRLIDVRDVQMS